MEIKVSLGTPAIGTSAAVHPGRVPQD